MGISTYQSYCGAQIFDAVGLSTEFVEKYFFGTETTIEGVGLAEVAQETVLRHQAAFGNVEILKNALDVGGEYAFRQRGESHAWTPSAVTNLQHAVRSESYSKYEAFAAEVNGESEKLNTIRGLFKIKMAEAVSYTHLTLPTILLV